ncbi:endonuclease/exonuclease/phosphatase family protein [Actinocorallia lasiicapitis]
MRARRSTTKIVWGATALWGAFAVARLTGADRIPGLDQLAVPIISMTPYAAATSVIPLAAALLSRNLRAVAVTGIVIAGFGAALLPRALGGGEPAADGPVLRVMTANLMFGEADPAELLTLIKDQKVDVLSVQEFTPDARNGLAAAGLRLVLPYEVTDPRWGPAGTGLYSRYPLTALSALPGTKFAAPRAALELDGRRIEVTAVHPPPPLKTGYTDWKRVLKAVPAPVRGGPVQIVTGDFNATLDHARFRALLDRGYTDTADRRGEGLTPTWGLSMFGPPLTLDHILVPGSVAVRSYSVHPLTGTDHRPVVAGLQLP